MAVPPPKTILVVGSSGLLGNALVRVFGRFTDSVVAVDLPDFDLASRSLVRASLENLRPDVIVNAAGLGNLDWLESRPNTAYHIHRRGTVHLREAAERSGALLVQISCAECERGHSVFAESKRAAEEEAARWPQHLIVRCSTLFGPMGERSGGHLLETILNAMRRTRRFRLIHDMTSSPTYTDHLALAIHGLIARERTGVYAIANAGSASPYEFVRELAARTGIPLELEPISHAEFGFLAPRSVDTSIPEGELPHWSEALQEYLDHRQGTANGEVQAARATGSRCFAWSPK